MCSRRNVEENDEETKHSITDMDHETFQIGLEEQTGIQAPSELALGRARADTGHWRFERQFRFFFWGGVM